MFITFIFKYPCNPSEFFHGKYYTEFAGAHGD